MRFRGPVLAGAALVFLASRLLGLHFHAAFPDHEHAPHAVTAILIEAEVHDHHLDDHLLSGDGDVETIALPTVHKPPATAAILYFCQGAGSPLESLVATARAEKPPLPPPRSARSLFNLPPSQGPPLLA